MSTFSVVNGTLSVLPHVGDWSHRVPAHPQGWKSDSSLVIFGKSNAPSDDPHCDICGRVFKHRASMTRHRLVHFEKKFKCGDCGKKFHTSQKLKRHETVHQQHFPFSCEDCGKRFRRADNRNSHERTHTPAQYRPPTVQRTSYVPLSKRERGGAEPKFDLRDYPEMAEYLRRDPPPTVQQARTFLKGLRAADDLSPTKSMVRHMAKKLKVKLAQPLRRRRIGLPHEKPSLDAELLHMFEQQFPFDAAESGEDRPRAQQRFDDGGAWRKGSFASRRRIDSTA